MHIMHERDLFDAKYNFVVLHFLRCVHGIHPLDCVVSCITSSVVKQTEYGLSLMDVSAITS